MKGGRGFPRSRPFSFAPLIKLKFTAFWVIFAYPNAKSSDARIAPVGCVTRINRLYGVDVGFPQIDGSSTIGRDDGPHHRACRCVRLRHEHDDAADDVAALLRT